MTKREEYREVYSTDKGAICSGCSEPISSCKCGALRKQLIKGDGDIKVRRENKGRAGKTVTTISGVAMNTPQLKQLLSDLKRLAGGGGAEKDGVLELQGDHCETVIKELTRRGLRAKRAGG
jgi:translation initiation factor 1